MFSNLSQDELLNEFHQQMCFVYNSFSFMLSTSRPEYKNIVLGNARDNLEAAADALDLLEQSNQKILLVVSLSAAQAYYQYMFLNK